MKTTPWDEALRQAIHASSAPFFYQTARLPLPYDVFALWNRSSAGIINAALKSLSKQGYRLVPAEPTEEMLDALGDYCPAGTADATRAVIRAGDVLKVKP
jgi:hypothetical protein